MQEEVTQKTVTFCIRATKITADLLKKVLVAYLRHQKQKSVEKKAQKNTAETGKGHGKRAGKTECRDGQYRDHGQKYQVL